MGTAGYKGIIIMPTSVDKTANYKQGWNGSGKFYGSGSGLNFRDPDPDPDPVRIRPILANFYNVRMNPTCAHYALLAPKYHFIVWCLE